MNNVATALDWSDVKRALVIVAHPDDADFICAGTCIQMARQGIEVTYMVLTNGDKGNHNPEITRNQLIAMRQIEQRQAAALAASTKCCSWARRTVFYAHGARSASASRARSGASARS
jgi:LmbE family N-acetylglucosaminyl deacetylase